MILPQRIRNWSLTSLQQRLVKTGGRLVKHARYYWLLLAESHLTRRLFGAMVRRIELLPCQQDRPAEEGADFSDERAGDGKVSETSVGKAAVSGAGTLRRRKTAIFRGPWRQPALKTRLNLASRGGRAYADRRLRIEKGNSG
jgi:hypothetical protein